MTKFEERTIFRLIAGLEDLHKSLPPAERARLRQYKAYARSFVRSAAAHHGVVVPHGNKK